MAFRANRRVIQALTKMGLWMAVAVGGNSYLSAQDYNGLPSGVINPPTTYQAPSGFQGIPEGSEMADASNAVQPTGFFCEMFDEFWNNPAPSEDGCCKGWCNLGEPWKLSKAKGFDYAGWIEMGYQSHADGAFTSAAEAGKFNLQQLYLYSAKVADGSEGWDWGYRFDTYYGVDGNEGQSFGNPAGTWDYLNGFDHGIYEIALPQAYLEVAHCDLSVKIGHFYTPIGYEVVTSPDNFFLSRQLTFYNSEPFTHTGALGTYKYSDKLSIIGGWTLGWDTGYAQLNQGSNGISGLVYTYDENTTITYMNGFGNFGWRGQGMINSFIFSEKFGDKWQYVSQFDVLGTNTGTNFAATGIADNSTGWINYLFYSFNDCLKFGYRTEWYKATGTSYYTNTWGLNYRPHPNLVFRPEIRYNNSPGDPNPTFNHIIYGIDAIAKF
ncbi:MAG: outer membrane beta-barrel protein [Planctomycetales bacterium]